MQGTCSQTDVEGHLEQACTLPGEYEVSAPTTLLVTYRYPTSRRICNYGRHHIGGEKFCIGKSGRLRHSHACNKVNVVDEDTNMDRSEAAAVMGVSVYPTHVMHFL